MAVVFLFPAVMNIVRVLHDVENFECTHIQGAFSPPPALLCASLLVAQKGFERKRVSTWSLGK